MTVPFPYMESSRSPRRLWFGWRLAWPQLGFAAVGVGLGSATGSGARWFYGQSAEGERRETTLESSGARESTFSSLIVAALFTGLRVGSTQLFSFL